MLNDSNRMTKPKFDVGEDAISATDNDHFAFEQFCFTYLFWTKAWTPVGEFLCGVLNDKGQGGFDPSS